QWEFACRAGTTTAVNNGGAATADAYKEVGWYSDNSAQGTSDGSINYQGAEGYIGCRFFCSVKEAVK
ncbi:MAG: hypothetical protein PHV28_12990, partial [Kiritimatiellae bacterium]|nr:hypothetical protein [Kiritimatiellia bacterium]